MEMPVNVGDETIQDFIDIWENPELGLPLVSMPRCVPPRSLPKGGAVYREGPRFKVSAQELGMNVGWERGEEEEPALYLQLQTSFERQDMTGNERWATRRASDGSSACSCTSGSTEDSETMVLTPFILSHSNPSSPGADQTLSLGGERSLRSLSASASTGPDYELSPVNLSPVPDGLYPHPLFPQSSNTPGPAPVVQESFLHPILSRASPPRLPRPTTPLRLASVPEITHQRSHSSTGATSCPSPQGPYFENPRARPVTPARKAVSTPSSPERLRAIWPLPIDFRSTGVGESPTASLPRSWGSSSATDGPGLTRKASRILGIDFRPKLALPRGLRSYSSNLSTASSSVPPLSSGHSSTTSTASTSSTRSTRSSASTPSSALPYDPTEDCVTLTTALNQYAKSRKIPHLLNKTVARIALRPSNLENLNQAFASLPSNQSRSLDTEIRTQTTGPHRLLLLKLLSGPHRNEAEWLSTYCRSSPGQAHTQVPPDDKLVAEIIFGKSPRELRLLKAAFAELNNGWNICDALAELYPEGTSSAAFGRAARRLMKCDRDEGEPLGARRNEDIVAQVEDLYAVGRGGGGIKYLDQRLLLEVVIRRSDAFLRDLCRRFRERHARELVDVVAARERVIAGKGGVWPNNLEYAVIHALCCASSRPARDAKLLHDTIGILWVRDTRLIARAARLHFNQRHLRAVRAAYKAKYGKDLGEGIGGEIKRGAYRDLMVRVLEGARV
ncbi:unnamed protein product [Tuber aestivum]|uniref:Annexin n=1 Tax=Tuber aestivum TaxID=59557 RepID=A0A292Q504_9PEZI|nr:unnamed protein product [Tuber aestivum]